MGTGKSAGRTTAEPIRSKDDLKECRAALVRKGDAVGLLLFLCGIHTPLSLDQLLTLEKSAVTVVNEGEMTISSKFLPIDLLDGDVTFKLYDYRRNPQDEFVTASEFNLVKYYLALVPDNVPLFARVFSTRGVREFVQNLTAEAGIKPVNPEYCFSGDTLKKTFGYMLAVHERIPLSDLRKMFGKLTVAAIQQYLCIYKEEIAPRKILEW